MASNFTVSKKAYLVAVSAIKYIGANAGEAVDALFLFPWTQSANASFEEGRMMEMQTLEGGKVIPNHGEKYPNIIKVQSRNSAVIKALTEEIPAGSWAELHMELRGSVITKDDKTSYFTNIDVTGITFDGNNYGVYPGQSGPDADASTAAVGF